METKKFGRLFLDGEPTATCGCYSDAAPGDADVLKRDLRFGDTCGAKDAILWVGYKDILVSTQVFCVNISRTELYELGFLDGRPVRIDGAPYVCRSLNLYPRVKDHNNEWTDVLKGTAELEQLWGWSDFGFWGGGADERGNAYAVLPRMTNANHVVARTVGYRSPIVGFRPVLEPLSPEPEINEDLLGALLALYVGNSVLVGRLLSFTDYDLVLANEEGVVSQPECDGASRDLRDGTFIVDRAAVDYLHQEPKKGGR